MVYEPVLMSDPVVSAVPVQDCGEPLVDLRGFGAFHLDSRLADDAGAYALLRRGVAERLLVAQELLEPDLALLVVEGYRPPELQERYFQESVDELRTSHPGWTQSALRREAGRYISPPEVAPHVSGAAVDLTLCTREGLELPMGTEVNATPLGEDGPCYTASRGISAEARRNRRTMGGALAAAGLVNYPTEWWHWSYGDRYWAFVTGAGRAVYGRTRPS
ncbi:M15 family metallopeptidase [Streptosporangium sp. NPDC004379]|uniref:M15 family metallopeptidase n=1 Tax=Streptosporangium sp. NPDC004379 TaxID=3366189 RepID=UPI0036C4C7B3